MVIDNGNPTLSSSTRVVVTVDDVNDNAPEFLERFYKIQIPATIISHPESAVLQVLKFIFGNLTFSSGKPCRNMSQYVTICHLPSQTNQPQKKIVKM